MLVASGAGSAGGRPPLGGGGPRAAGARGLFGGADVCFGSQCIGHRPAAQPFFPVLSERALQPRALHEASIFACLALRSPPPWKAVAARRAFRPRPSFFLQVTAAPYSNRRQ